MAGSPHFPSSLGQRVIVGVGDVAASNDPHVTLSTYALGSCIGVVAYDPMIRVGGILHLMLPHSSIAPAKALTQPAMFADTGLPLLFGSLAGLKAERDRLILLVLGGANVFRGKDTFKVGERNLEATMLYLSENRIRISRSLVGGTMNRTVHLDINSGILTLKTPGGVDSIPLGR